MFSLDETRQARDRVGAFVAAMLSLDTLGTESLKEPFARECVEIINELRGSGDATTAFLVQLAVLAAEMVRRVAELQHSDPMAILHVRGLYFASAAGRAFEQELWRQMNGGDESPD